MPLIRARFRPAPHLEPAAPAQVIVKEERQLNAPKPRITVKHVWNPEDLAGRKTTWKEHVRVRRFENTDKMTVRGPTHNRYSRSTMLHERKCAPPARIRRRPTS